MWMGRSHVSAFARPSRTAAAAEIAAEKKAQAQAQAQLVTVNAFGRLVLVSFQHCEDILGAGVDIVLAQALGAHDSETRMTRCVVHIDHMADFQSI